MEQQGILDQQKALTPEQALMNITLLLNKRNVVRSDQEWMAVDQAVEIISTIVKQNKSAGGEVEGAGENV